MKTSVIEVHDMLSVLSVNGVEERIRGVPGVESATVNFAAGSATVRYDETRLEIADIRSGVRQSGFESTAPAAPMGNDGHEGHAAPGSPPAPPPTSTPAVPAVAPAPAGSGNTHQHTAVPPPTKSLPSTAAPAAASAPNSAAPKSGPDAVSGSDEPTGKGATEKS